MGSDMRHTTVGFASTANGANGVGVQYGAMRPTGRERHAVRAT